VTITILDSGEAVARALARSITNALREKAGLVLGLATGRTPVDAYAELRRMHDTGHGDWSGASTFNLDEFAGIDSRHPGSFRQFMQRHLFDGVNIDASRIHFLNGAAADLDVECDRYEEAIRRAGGIDLQVLGIGSNGHIGFNEPGDELIVRTHRVRLLASTRLDNASLFGDDPSHVPAEALSMGIGTILQARRIVLVATGAKKADCIARTVNGRITTRVPASMLQAHRDVEVLLDREAAAHVRRNVRSA
jgi:glucosamine-6-phosphate deaminase